MPHTFANTLFTEPVKELQARNGSRESYERLARSGAAEQSLGPDELEFISARDSFYIATVTPDGWPYVQHRGGPAGFLAVLDEQTLSFADYAGNKQYISTGNLTVNDRVALFLMDYPHQARLKIIGHARFVDRTSLDYPALAGRLPVEPGARVDRIFVIQVVGFDWNCSQHITPRYSAEELRAISGR
jgi:hypothetical protein